MKEMYKKIVAVFVLLIAAYLFDFSHVIAQDNSLSSFLEFEQAIIEMSELDDSEISLYGLEDNVDIVDETYKLKRLIVQGNIKNDYGAIDVVSYNNLHVLSYKSRQDTKYAYENLIKDKTLDVFIDEVKELEEYSEQDYDYSAYKNWGAQSIDIGGYRQYLLDNNVNKQVVVVVLDTGINTSHSMFNNRLLTDSNGKIKGFSYYNSSYRYSYNNLAFDVDDITTPNIDEGDTNKYSFEDDHGHGAHVAGIITSLTPNNVKILPIKIGNSAGKSTTKIMISAYLRVIEIYSKQYNVVSTNLSYSGGGKDSEAEKRAFNEQCYQPLLDLNILPVTAAGNDSTRNDIEGLKAVVVSALKKQDKEYVFDKSYSNYGKIIDISAPGSSILSAGIASSDKANTSIVSKSGTSMASPQVAGVVALLYLNPNLPSNYDALYIENMLYELSLDMGEPNKDIYYGEGMLNLKYFEVKATETLSFYKNGVLINDYVDNENFIDSFALEIKCSNSQFKIIYTIDKTIPTVSNHISYTQTLTISDSVTLYAMGVKLVNNKIVERTDLYKISYFLKSTPVEECFSVDSRGNLVSYTCNYSDLIIPSVINGQTITGIYTSLFKESNIESITLPETVTNIGGYAFKNAKKLKYIYAPGVTKILIAAFSNCESLTLVSDIHPTSNIKEGAYFPNLKETIGFSFSGCNNIESISLSKLETMGDDGYDFQTNTKLKSVNLPMITSIPQGTFSGCTSLSGLFEITRYIETIGLNAFKNTGISKFIVNGNNKYFYSDGKGLYSKTSLIAYATEDEIIDYEILDSVTINNTKYQITTIESNIIYNKKVNSLTIPETITNIKHFAFDKTEIETLYFNAINCSHEGYYDKEEMMRGAVFNKIGTIVIGEKVVNVPERLFQSVYFDTLIINSRETVFLSASFYRMDEQGDLDKLVFNFSQSVDTDYLKMVTDDSCLLTNSKLNYLYSKTQVDVSSVYNLSKLIYTSRQGDYIVYSRLPLANVYTITSGTYNNGGNITPLGIIEVGEGESKTFSIVINEGYYIKSITVDNILLTEKEIENAIEKGYSFTNITNDHTIYVEFAPCVYTITYIDNDGNKLTSVTPASYTYGVGVTLPILPEKGGYEFVGWYENSNYSGSVVTEISTTDLGNKVYYAKYIIRTYTITVIQPDNGSISEAKTSYNKGENATFVITANSGYHILYVVVDNVFYELSTTEYKFTNITKDHTISAIFEANKNTNYTIKHWQQSLTNEGAVAFGDFYYTLTKIDQSNFGTTNTKTEAKPNTYAGFSSQPIIQEIILGDESTVVNILYNRNHYYLTLLKGDGIQTVSNSKSYLYGESVRIDATVKEGYTWNLWESSKPNIIENSNEKEYSFTMPSEEIKLTATANINQYIITILQTENGSITPSYNQTVNYGQNLELRFDPNYGYELKELLVNNISEIAFVNVNKYTIRNISENITVEAIFDLKEYTIETTYNIASLQKQTMIVKHGEDKIVEFMDYNGYEITNIIVDDMALSNEELLLAINDGYTFKNIKASHTIKVIFSKQTFRIKTIIEGNGIVNPKGEIEVTYGESKVFNFTANEGSYIYEVILNDVSLGVIESYFLMDIKDNYEFKVVFKKNILKFNIEIEGKGNYKSEKDLNCIEKGDNVSIKLLPDDLYQISQVFVGEKEIEIINNNIEIINVQDDKNIKIIFKEKEKNDIKKEEETKSNGLSCSKNSQANKGAFADMLFVLLTIIVVAYPKKRLIK